MNEATADEAAEAARLVDAFLAAHVLRLGAAKRNPRGDGYAMPVGCSCGWRREGLVPIAHGEVDPILTVHRRHTEAEWSAYLEKVTSS